MFEAKARLGPGEFECVENLIFESDRMGYWNLYENFDDKGNWIHGIFESPESMEAGIAELESIGSFKLDWDQREVEGEEWKDSYKEHFKPWSLGGLHWIPVWLRDTPGIPETGTVVWLDPGMAFGTGNHATTRLCVERLMAFKRSGSHQRSSLIVDAGCGSGILAISAAALGFYRIHGFDTDADSVRIAKENAALNGVSQIEFEVGGLAEMLPRLQADCLMANILADVLVITRRTLIDAVAPGGWLILSGILSTESSWVADAFASEHPWESIDVRELDEWASVTLVKRAAPC